jgi:hypothetical protein
MAGKDRDGDGFEMGQGARVAVLVGGSVAHVFLRGGDNYIVDRFGLMEESERSLL